MRVTDLYFPDSPTLPFLKAGVTFAFSQSSGTSPDRHDLSKITDIHLMTTSASSLSTHECIPSPTDLICAWSSTEGTYSMLHLLPLILVIWDCWRQILPVKMKQKEALSTSAFSKSCLQVSAPISSRPTHLPFAADIPVKAHCVTFYVPFRFNSRWALCFPNSSLSPWMVSLYSFTVTWSCFHLCMGFFMSEFCQELLVPPCWPPLAFDLLHIGTDNSWAWRKTTFEIN